MKIVRLLAGVFSVLGRRIWRRAMVKCSLIALFGVVVFVLVGCGNNDAAVGPEDGPQTTELFSNEKDLWRSTDLFRDDVCLDCDTYDLVWESEGWTTDCTFEYKWEQCFASRDGSGKPCWNFYDPFVGYEVEIIPHFDLSPYTEVTISWQSTFENNGSVSAAISPDGATWTTIGKFTHSQSNTLQRTDSAEIKQFVGAADGDVRVRFWIYAGVYDLNCSRHVNFCNESNRFRTAIRHVSVTGKKQGS